MAVFFQGVKDEVGHWWFGNWFKFKVQPLCIQETKSLFVLILLILHKSFPSFNGNS